MFIDRCSNRHQAKIVTLYKGSKITDQATMTEAAPDSRETVIRFPSRMAQFFQEVDGDSERPNV
jgi:hypothetical protein